MCIIVYKPQGVDMPDDSRLANCFVNNPDGAGYMFTENDKVVIKKGFMKYAEFIDSMKNDYERLGKETPFVLHFRIGTQGGNVPQLTHPFNISQDVKDLTKLYSESDIALAHNGIIHLTSSYRNTETSDTMDFITKYLSLIITDKDWHIKNNFNDNIELIEKLIGYHNKLAIMSSDNHVELIGTFIEQDGCYYSNETYSYSYYYDTKTDSKLSDFSISSTETEWNKHFNLDTGLYDFNTSYCPYMIEDDDRYCYSCSNFGVCYFGDDVNPQHCIEGRCSGCVYKASCPNANNEDDFNETLEGYYERVKETDNKD